MSNNEKFNLIHKKYRSYLKNICYSYTKNLDDAEDCLQEAFVKIYNNLDNIDLNQCKTYLSTITKNNAIDFLRKNKKSKNNIDIDSSEYCTYEYVSKDDAYQYNNLKEFINNNREKIGEVYSKIFCMYVFENYKHKDIAVALNMNLNTVRVDYMKAKQEIRKLFKEEGI